jgi:chromate transporter
VDDEGPELSGPPGLVTIAREWGRIGCIGFGGPPTHIALLRRLCVQRRRWISETEFEDGIAATNLLPGPASTQLAIFTAWRLRGVPGALVGGVCFIGPGLVLILALSVLFLAGHPPLWVRGAAAGAGSAVAAVAVQAASSLARASWNRASWNRASRNRASRNRASWNRASRSRSQSRAGSVRAGRVRWLAYSSVGAVAAAVTGPWLVLVLIAAGLAEVVVRRGVPRRRARPARSWPLLAVAPAAAGGLPAVAWVALKVGALSYGGGFVIIPLMQADAVAHYHWMTHGQFLDAVALGQVTPGPVVQTVAVVGYAAGGIGGGLLAALFAFAPSFVFVIAGGPRFDRLRSNETVQAFFAGAGPAVIGAIAGSAVPLALALQHWWQAGVLAAALGWLLVARRGVVSALLTAGALGVLAATAGWPVS